MIFDFVKMHGLGNDFVIIDARAHADQASRLTAAQIRLIADRKRGLGCDQLIILRKAKDEAADVFMSIINADGSEVEACGNASRCVAFLIHQPQKQSEIKIEIIAGVLTADVTDQNRITIDMGKIKTAWQEIPLAKEVDCKALPIHNPYGARAPLAINIGNPHVVFFVDDVMAVPLADFGREMEHHHLFPQKVNVSIAQSHGADHFRHRVWERGVGITMACGTAGCAVTAAAVITGQAGPRVKISLDGGDLMFDYLENGHMLMTGGVTMVARGQFDESFLKE
jgi:diaminopimelate epimerase